MNICDDVLTIPLPHYLQQHKDEIIHIFNGASIGSYNSQRWQEHFKDNNEVSNDLVEIIKRCSEKISRTDVGHFAIKARNRNYDDLRRLFLACMIWGWGKRGIGLSNTKTAILDPELKTVLKNAVARIKKGQIQLAYEEFELKGCKSAFFTKFFYFLGKTYGIEPLPLILDSRVAAFLRFLSKEEGWDLSLFAKTGRKGYVRLYSEGYIQYVCSMNSWAEQIGCPPDNLEYFMYKEDKKQGNLKQNNKRREIMGGKLKESKRKWLKNARRFCQENKRVNECAIIDEMERPLNWNLSKQGVNGKPKWWFNPRAAKGNFLLLWEARGISDRPNNWEDPVKGVEAIKDYITNTPEGKSWVKNNKPDWIPENWLSNSSVVQSQQTAQATTQNQITINLSKKYYDKLEEIAQECDTDINTFASILLVIQLRQ